jgi:D-alanyl-D-alanine carboxypeptidase
MKTKKAIFTLVLLSICLLSTTFVQAQSSGFVLTSQQPIVWPQVKAASAIVYDPISAKILYQKDADTVRPLASLGKLMTASVADTILRWSTKMSSTPIQIKSGYEFDTADKVLKNGTLWNPADLVSYMLVGSSNKASEQLASSLVDRNVFISLMNHQARQWGLTHTTFNNASGLTEKVSGKDVAGASSSAKEVALMMWHIIENHPNLLDSTRIQQASFSADNSATITIKNTNTLLSELPIIFGKTGFTEQAGGNLAVVVQKNATSHPYVIVVLGSTLEDRFTDVQALASTSQQLLTYQH